MLLKRIPVTRESSESFRNAHLINREIHCRMSLIFFRYLEEEGGTQGKTGINF